MSKLRITVACGGYDRTLALRDGTVKVDGIDLNYISLEPEEIFWRSFQFEDFDASELSLSGFILERSRGVHRFIAIPVFPSRMFRHSNIYINTDAGVRKPEDLKGKEVGVPEYHMTAALWVRAILQHEYGVKPSDVVWRTGGHEQPGRKERVELKMPPDIVVKPIGDDQTLTTMLERGEIAALVSPRLSSRHPKVRRLFPNYRELEEAYYKKTKLYMPIMHTIVIKEKLYQENPWVAISLYKAFREAKEICLKKMYDPNALIVSLPHLIPDIERARELYGDDLWPYGFKNNKPMIEKMIQFSHEQGLAERIFPAEELFAKQTWDDSKI